MESQDDEVRGYAFLEEERVERHFADINILLLSGKHIDHKFYSIFSILETYESPLKHFYKNLYKLNLEADFFDGCKCYYLDFSDAGKGKLSDSNRNIELTELQTVVGLTLLDMYYQKYFDQEKIIHWSDIKNLILLSEHQEAYKRIFFDDIRESYDEKEWNSAKNQVGRAIDSFDKLGWVEKQSNKNEELVFEIRPAIHRLGKLYGEELQNFETFSQLLKKNEES